MEGPAEVGEFVKEIKTNEKIFSCQTTAKNLVLDFEVGKNLDCDGSCEFGDLEMFTIDSPEGLVGSFPMCRRKNLGIDDGCGCSGIKKCYNGYGSGKWFSKDMDTGSGSRLNHI